MDKNLVIPVTADQRATVNHAAETAGKDMAAWAREILLKAAKRQA
jgi:hypothetical protein